MSATAPDGHASQSRIPILPGYVGAPIFGLQVGTGGAATADYLKTKGDKGYQSPWFDLGREAHSLPEVKATPTENLAHIRSVLRPSVTDLARALGVSRQAIYDWQAGRPIAVDNVARIEEISRAANLFAREGLQATAHMMRRPIRSGQNFFEIVRNGGSAEAAAGLLIGIVRRELKEREKLESRLADRPEPNQEDYRDLGAPMLDEKG
jgi:transcriptional regulator with XRE-family HTH domain